MTDKQLIDLTKQLTAIESAVDNPAGLRQAYDFMRDMVRASGKDITIEEFEKNGLPSFLAYKGSKRPDKFHIILNGHVDVVPGRKSQFTPTVTDGKLYGRGVYDMKAAAVILADVFCEFVDKVPYALGLQIVTDEEAGGYDGTFHQVAQGVRANFVVCGDCGRHTNVREIAHETKGLVVSSITFTGTTAHGAYPWRGDNAALKASRFVQALHARFPAPDAETPNTTVTITAVEAAGGSMNRIPDTAVVKLDARFAPGDPQFSTREAFTKLIHGLDPQAGVEIQMLSAPLYTKRDNPLLLALKAAAEETEGAPFNLVRRHGTNDGRHFGDVGNEACEFGLAGEDQHGDNEHITLKAFSDYHQTMRYFLDKTLKT